MGGWGHWNVVSGCRALHSCWEPMGHLCAGMRVGRSCLALRGLPPPADGSCVVTEIAFSRVTQVLAFLHHEPVYILTLRFGKKKKN